MKNNLKIAVIGLGGRGMNLIECSILPVCIEYNAEISAVYDELPDRTDACIKLITEKTGKSPYGAKSYDEILNDGEITGVIIASAWENHIPDAIRAMKHGKYVGLEVGGAYNIEDCFKLVDTFEETGCHCMLLENCCYGERELLALNMMRKGLFGDIVHASGGYMHDLRYEVTHGLENRHYRLRNYLHRNSENYPTHELGPIAKVLDINNGNRLVSLTSTSSSAKGLHEYIKWRKGKNDRLLKEEFYQGDIVTTVIKCYGGQTITITLDTTLPRTYSRGFTLRGTKGAYFGETDSVFIDQKHNKFEFSGHKLWGNAKRYLKKYEHPLWQNYTPVGGHDGMDYHVISAFFEAMTKNVRPPIDVYDTATYMAITALSEQSIQLGSAPVLIPDFTRGKWFRRNDIDYTLKYNLDKPTKLNDLFI